MSFGALALALLSPAFSTGAQSGSFVRGCVLNVRGVVLPNATVTAVGTLASTRTAEDGCFRLLIARGEWRLTVRRLGYHPVEVRAEASNNSNDSVLVILESATAALGRLVINGDATEPFTTSITPVALRQIPALGERDVFRALPVHPRLSQPNDILSRAHLAGGGSDEHAITLNGHPLQAPFHINSVFGAVNPGALDRVDVAMHHLPSNRYDRLSGSIDLYSRQGDLRPAREAQLSVLSLGGTIVQPKLFGNTTVLASARASYLDAVLQGLNVGDGAGGDDNRVPAFRDALVTARTHWSSRLESELLVFHTRDSWPEVGGSWLQSPTWGENLLGVRVDYGTGPWHTQVRLSTNHATVQQRFEPGMESPVTGSDPRSAVFDRPELQFIDMSQRWHSGLLEARYQQTRWTMSAGLGVDARRHVNAWAGRDAQERLLAELPLAGHYNRSQLLVSSFVEGSTVTSSHGIRSVLGVRASTVNGATHFAPRLRVSLPMPSYVTLALSLDRRHQFEAIAAEPVEGTLTQPVFFLDTPRSADVAAFSMEWRPLGESTAARVQSSVTVFGKQFRRRPVLPIDSSPRSFGTPTTLATTPTFWEPPFNRVDGFAFGATIGFDLVFPSGWLLQGSYTRQRVRDRRDGQMLPTPWDAPHQLTALLGLPVGRGWQITLANQLRSGAAVTPLIATVLTPTPAGFLRKPIAGAPLSARAPSFYRTDVGVQKSWSARGARWTLSAQAINALSRSNASRHVGDAANRCRRDSFDCNYRIGNTTSLPVLPSLGLEVRW